MSLPAGIWHADASDRRAAARAWVARRLAWERRLQRAREPRRPEPVGASGG
jgi:hypothetical protein